MTDRETLGLASVDRRTVAERTQRDRATNCGNAQHAGFTCAEFDDFIREQIETNGGCSSRSLTAVLEQHRGYDPVLWSWLRDR
jgi:hypothetical protein